MRKYGLIGYPLGHSFSRKYFTEKFLASHITDAVYDNYPMESLDGLMDLIRRESSLLGLNVTIPYKSEVIKYLDHIDPEAEEIGAVNVIKIARSGDKVRLSGFNSDVTGIREALFPHLSGAVTNALVLGTGGSSRAVCHVLRKRGIYLDLVSRESKAGVLSYHDISNVRLSQAQLIVNTTPLGMYPHTEGKPDLDYSSLTGNQVLFDLVYNPELTSFLKMGKERGCTIVSGIKMLYSQAEKAWEIWNNPG